VNKSLRRKIKRIKNKFRDNLLFLSIWVLALGTVLGVNIVSKTSYTFVGETDSKEISINSNHAVIVKNINVISGQLVRKGQLLIELARPDLEKSISEFEHKVAEIKTGLKINESLSKSIKSFDAADKNIENPLSIQLKSLEHQLKILEKEKLQLFIFATFDGHIGSVNYKNGESVSPFTPIVSMHSKTPNFVRGYIHERIANNVIEDATVEITTLTSNIGIKAQVSNVGTRIIELPERFRRSETEKIWGREVMIRLPEDNKFLLGEKVFLEVVEEGKIIKKRVIAETSEIKSERITEIVVPKSIRKKTSFEPSGIVYMKNINRYFVISDDTPKNEPLIYVMNMNGEIEKNPIKIKGIKKIKDIESISLDEDGFLYILSSMSRDKSGKISRSRKFLYKIKVDGFNLEKVGEINLYNYLVAQSSTEESLWKKYFSVGSKFAINIEGMAIKDNELFLGVRNSIGEDNQVGILSVKNLLSLFSKNKKEEASVTLKILLNLPIRSNQDLDEGISDLFWKGEELNIVTASNRYKDKGRLLSYYLNGLKGPELVRDYHTNRPEGGVFNPHEKEYIVVFDSNKSKQAYMTRFYEN
jgi:hypothetical protein